MTLSLLPQTVTVVTYDNSTEDAYGNPTRAQASSTSVPGRLEQMRSLETTLGQDTVLDRWRAFLPAGTAINAGDEIEEGGRRFRVDGTPELVYGASSVHHIEATLVYSGDVA